ncbi:MAG: PHP domain-containing protein, partial [Anaerolineae bacterium]
MWHYLLADLHLHTVLSACAEVEMIPPLIVRRARELGLGLIAVTDHNAALNVQAVIDAAAGSGLAVLPGMEVQSREEVHLVCLFDTVEQVRAWQERVWAALPDRHNDGDFFGAQYVVDAGGEYLYTEKRLLSVAAALSVED